MISIQSASVEFQCIEFQRTHSLGLLESPMISRSERQGTYPRRAARARPPALHSAGSLRARPAAFSTTWPSSAAPCGRPATCKCAAAPAPAQPPAAMTAATTRRRWIMRSPTWAAGSPLRPLPAPPARARGGQQRVADNSASSELPPVQRAAESLLCESLFTYAGCFVSLDLTVTGALELSSWVAGLPELRWLSAAGTSVTALPPLGAATGLTHLSLCSLVHGSAAGGIQLAPGSVPPSLCSLRLHGLRPASLPFVAAAAGRLAQLHISWDEARHRQGEGARANAGMALTEAAQSKWGYLLHAPATDCQCSSSTHVTCLKTNRSHQW